MPDVASAPVGDTPAVAAVAAPAAVAAVVDPAVATPAPAVAAPAVAVDPAAAPKPLEDWATLRATYAKEDEKLLKRLERYSSPKDALDALIAAQNKIAAGGMKSTLPEKPTPEQLAEYRKDNGIPAKPGDYDIGKGSLPISEADGPVIDSFLKAAHDANFTEGQAKQALGWFFQNQQAELNAQVAAEAAQKEVNIEALRKDWGSEYQLNLNLIDNFLNTAPAGLADQILGARLADGSPLANNPDALRWLASTAREINPTATVVPGSGTGSLDTIVTEKAKIEKLMGDYKSEYHKGPGAQAMQQRYRDLVDVEVKLQKRS
jgi:hypothetical protein